jgi:hypothetical protein
MVRFPICPRLEHEKARSHMTIRLTLCLCLMSVGVKIGNILRQFSIKNADTSEQKLKFLKNS